MAFPRDLVALIADVFGVSEATVALHDRLLAEAGLRSSGGRGRSAAKVTPEDAAHLLIAIAAAPIAGPAVRDSAQNVKRYAELPATHEFFLDRPVGWSEVSSLHDLSPGHNFASALASVIRAVAAGKLVAMDEVWPAGTNSPVHDPGFIDLVVEVSGPAPSAMLQIDGYRTFPTPDHKTMTLRYRHPPSREKPHWKYGHLERDLIQIRRFSRETFRALAQLFPISAA